MSLQDKIRSWLDYEEKMIDVEDVKEFIQEVLDIVYSDFSKELKVTTIKVKAGEKLLK